MYNVNMDTLTTKQETVLRYIKVYIELQGYPPSLREMMEFMGFKSTNGIRCHLKALERKGFIEIDANIARGIKCLKLS